MCVPGTPALLRERARLAWVVWANWEHSIHISSYNSSKLHNWVLAQISPVQILEPKMMPPKRICFVLRCISECRWCKGLHCVPYCIALKPLSLCRKNDVTRKDTRLHTLIFYICTHSCTYTMGWISLLLYMAIQTALCDVFCVKWIIVY